MSKPARRGSFSPDDQDRLIKALRDARSLIIKCMASELYGSSRYQICDGTRAAIDAMGAELTGDATVFWLKAHSTS